MQKGFYIVVKVKMNDSPRPYQTHNKPITAALESSSIGLGFFLSNIIARCHMSTTNDQATGQSCHIVLRLELHVS